jgi:uncharacterized YceG family protein
VAGLLVLVVSGFVWHSVVSVSPFADGVPAEARSTKAKAVELLVPAGWRLEQVADLLDTYDIVEARPFLKLVRDPETASATTGEDGLSSLEGYLAPGRYILRPGMEPAQVVHTMAARSRRWLPDQRVARSDMSRREVLTLASIVEREAGFTSDMPAIAAVFRNRLRRYQPLQTDASVIYALDSARGVGGDATLYWLRELTPKRKHARELRFPSPYNTYRNIGLPPAPIASPSQEAIDAALDTPHLPLRYFLGKRSGTSVFARTFAQHKRNIRRYGGMRSTPSTGVGLQGVIERVAEPFDGHVGLVVQDLDTGERAQLNDTDFFSAAGLSRLFVMYAAFVERSRGNLRFDKRAAHPLRWQNELYPLEPGPTIARMLRGRVLSGNERRAKTLMRMIGERAVIRALRRAGLRHTFRTADRFITTPSDVARLVRDIEEGRGMRPRAAARMRGMLRGGNGAGLERYLPGGAHLLHQRGVLYGLRHDAGVIETGGARLLVVAMTEGVSDVEYADDGIGRLGQDVTGFVDEYRDLETRVQPRCPYGLAPLAPGRLTGRSIVLDAGHGGVDTGARFRFDDGFRLDEKNVTLDIARRLGELLRLEGATVYLTRCDDQTVSLDKRAVIANRWSADLMVSLHLNASDRPATNGTEIFYLSRPSRVLANYVRGTFTLPGIWTTLNRHAALADRGIGARRFSILVYSQVPTVLTESLYMSNPAEAAALRHQHGPRSRREQIARGHLRGILNYFEQR